MPVPTRLTRNVRVAVLLACTLHLAAGAAVAQQSGHRPSRAQATVQASRPEPASAPVLLSPTNDAVLAGGEFAWRLGAELADRHVEYTLTVAELPPGRRAEEALREAVPPAPRTRSTAAAARGPRFAMVMGRLEGSTRRRDGAHRNLLPEALAARLVPGRRYAWSVALRAEGRELGSSPAATFTAPPSLGGPIQSYSIGWPSPTLLLYYDQSGDQVMQPEESDPGMIEELPAVFRWDGSPAVPSDPYAFRLVRLNYVWYATDPWVDANGVVHHPSAANKLDDVPWLMSELNSPNAVVVPAIPVPDPANPSAFQVQQGQLEYDRYYAARLTWGGDSSQILVFRYDGP